VTLPRVRVMRRGDRGSVTIMLAAMLPVVLVLAMGTADLGRTLVARSRARAAADAAALAAAQELALPTGADPAELARSYASRNGAELVGCAVGSFEATVDVRVPVGDLLLIPGAPVAVTSARAVVDLPTG
jgi:secretion/DNA translocation related TadE-like protein